MLCRSCSNLNSLTPGREPAWELWHGRRFSGHGFKPLWPLSMQCLLVTVWSSINAIVSLTCTELPPMPLWVRSNIKPKGRHLAAALPCSRITLCHERNPRIDAAIWMLYYSLVRLLDVLTKAVQMTKVSIVTIWNHHMPEAT